MGRPSNVDIFELADRLVKEVAERLRSSPFAHLRNITRGEKSVKKRFSCGADTAKKVHALAVSILQEKGYVQFKASMGKQLTFCKPTKKDEAKEREEISTYAKFGVSAPSEVKARRKERPPDKAAMEKDKQPDKRPAKRRHFLYKNQFATHELPEHMRIEDEESSSSSSGSEEDEDSSSSSSSSSSRRRPRAASSARSSAARKAVRGAKEKATQQLHRLDKADGEEKKSKGVAPEASADKAPASKAEAEEKKPKGVAPEASADKAPASNADGEEKKSKGVAPEASADKAPASKAEAEEKKPKGVAPEASADKADGEEKKSKGVAPEASADKAPASKAEAEEKKSKGVAPEASADKAPASNADAEEEESMDVTPEAPAKKAPASKILVAESSKALEAMAMSIGAEAPAALAEPVPNVPPDLPPLPAQGFLYSHLAGSSPSHPRDEVQNIIQQLIQLGDTVEAMQA